MLFWACLSTFITNAAALVHFSGRNELPPVNANDVCRTVPAAGTEHTEDVAPSLAASLGNDPYLRERLKSENGVSVKTDKSDADRAFALYPAELCFN